ncbi:hypothetical protein SCO12_15160 [Legionella pneumophila serogroup 10]
MKQTILKKIVNVIILTCTLASIATDTTATNVGMTTVSNTQQRTVLSLQVIEPVIELNKQMIKTAKLDAFDNKYGRVDLTLTREASKQLFSMGKLKKNQKLIFTINNEISEALMVQGNNNSFLLSISTSRKNADLIMKIFS